jgi:hypothetical protein
MLSTLLDLSLDISILEILEANRERGQDFREERLENMHCVGE